MPINSMHPSFVVNINKWRRCRDAFDGQDAIKNAGTLYLPRLSKQTERDYLAYKERALFYSITSKTVAAMVGMAMSRPPIIKVPLELEQYIKDANGSQFFEILTQALSETLLIGRFSVFIDRPLSGGKANFATYSAESVINWRLLEDGSPNLIVLNEDRLVEDDKDPYLAVYKSSYRELVLIGDVFHVRVYDDRLELIESNIPINNGIAMNFIPFITVNPLGIGLGIEKPPMLDIVDINISHYRTSADLEHGRHYTALPTPVVSGVEATAEMTIGAQTAWVLPDSNAKAYYLEFTGQGLQSLEKALTEKQAQLASLSARLLDNSKRGSEAAEAVKLRYASESATLLEVVNSIESFMNKVYKTVAVMEGVNPEEVSITLNKEFLDSKISSAEIIALVKSYLEGGITANTLVHNLRRGDILPVDTDDEQEAAAIEARSKEIADRLVRKSSGIDFTGAR